MRNQLFATFGSIVLALGVAERVTDAAHQNHSPHRGNTDDDVRIASVSPGGASCPPGTAHVDVSEDGQAFTVIFDNYVTQVTPDQKKASGSCQLTVDVHVPAGWQYAIDSVDFRGFVSVEPDVTATLRSTYKMNGSGNQRDHIVSTDWQGPFDDNIQVSGLRDGAQLDYSRCGKGDNLKIKTDVDLQKAKKSQASGFIGVDSADGQIYHLNWRTCS